jgi:hypothetical protein
MGRRFRFDITRNSDLTFGLGLLLVVGLFLFMAGIFIGIAQSWNFLLLLMSKIGWLSYDEPHHLLSSVVGIAFAIFMFSFLDNEPETAFGQKYVFLRTLVFFSITVVGLTSLFAWYGLPPIVAATAMIADGIVRFKADIPFTIAASVACLLLAFLAFKLRRTNRKVYGHAEVLFGAFAIVYSIYDIQGDITKLSVQFFGGIYIIVRGLTNIEDGLASTLSLAGYFRSLRDDVVLPVIFENEI